MPPASSARSAANGHSGRRRVVPKLRSAALVAKNDDAAAIAATTLALRTLGVARHKPLWPYALERAALAGGILAVRYRRSR